MRVRFRSVALASVVGVLCVVTGGAAMADEVPAGELPSLPAVTCTDGVPTVPEDTAWAHYGMIDDGAALGVVWNVAQAGNPTDANGWERYFQDGNALLLRWDLDANGCLAADPELVTPAAPVYWGSSSPAETNLPAADGYHYEVAGHEVTDSVPIGPGQTVSIVAVPEDGYALAPQATSEWSITGVPSVVFPTEVKATFYCDHTYKVTWAQGVGHRLEDTYSARGYNEGTWTAMPADATEWVAGDYVALSVVASDGYGIYSDALADGWVLDGWGHGIGLQASFKIPFTGQCVPLDDGATDEETRESTEQPTKDTTATDDQKSTAAMPGHETTAAGERLPESGAGDAVQALISVGLVAAGGGLLALRRKLALG